MIFESRRICDNTAFLNDKVSLERTHNASLLWKSVNTHKYTHYTVWKLYFFVVYMTAYFLAMFSVLYEVFVARTRRDKALEYKTESLIDTRLYLRFVSITQGMPAINSTGCPKKNFNFLISCKLKTTVLTRSVFIFSESSYFSLNFGIKQSKIGWKFAEHLLPKAKISEPVDDRRPDFFETCINLRQPYYFNKVNWSVKISWICRHTIVLLSYHVN